MFTLEEVKKKTLEYFGGDELATNVWIDKYCLKTNKGELMEDSPLMMYERIAKELARIEQKYPNPLSYEEIYHLLKEQILLPGGSLLYGIGNNYSITSLGNCFVIGNEADSIGGIFTTAQEQAQLMKRRAGVGHDISHLRGKGVSVSNSAKTSTGLETWEDLYSFTTRRIAQDGRRGALMLSCDINHPQADEFIVSKDDTTKITGANISVKVTDKFMRGAEYGMGDKNMINFRKLIHQAWKTAEPGVLFWDKIISESPADCYEGFKSTSTNPCGEIPLCPYDSCRLLSINLTKFVHSPFTNQSWFNYEHLQDVAYKAQRLMDDVVDLEEEKISIILNKIESDPEPSEIKLIEKNLWIKIKEKLLQGRRTGLSGIGLADTLAMLGISYSGGIDTSESIYKNLAISAYKSSIDMANERGAFPIWNFTNEEFNPFLLRIHKELQESDRYSHDVYGRRNIALLTIPPSGTISLLAGISSGIEPVYQLSYKRRRKVDANHPNKSFQDKTGDWWEEYVVLHPKFKEWLVLTSQYSSGTSWDTLAKTISPFANSTAYELNPLDRVKLQGRIQQWVDHSISSTVNLPKETTEQQVSELYIEAWKQGCKGITIYRDGCRDGVLISNESQKETKFVTNDAPKRPKVLLADLYTPSIHNKDYIVVIGLYDGKPYEVFAFKNTYNLKGNYSCNIIKRTRGKYDVDIKDVMLIEDITSDMSQIEESTTRLVSTSLRHGASIEFLVEQLLKARGNGFQDFSKVIARKLKRYIKDETIVTGVTCENCGSTNIIYKDGCQECASCGSSKCG